MAVVTRAQVLAQLGLSDTTEVLSAFALGVDTAGGATDVIYNSTATGVAVEIFGGPDDGETGVYTFADYPTLTAMATAASALNGAVVNAIGDGTRASSPLTQENVTLGAGGVGTFQYDSTGTGSALTTYIDTLIPEVEDWVRLTTGRATLENEAVTERVDGGTSLEFSSPSVSSATIKQVDSDGTVVSTLASTEYDLDTDAGVAYPASATSAAGFAVGLGAHGVSSGPSRERRPSPSFVRGRRNYQLEYTAGAIDAALVGVIRQIIVDRALSRDHVRSLVSEAALSANRAYLSPGEMQRQHTHDLSRWMRPSVMF